MEAEGVTYDSTARHEPQYGVILSGAGACSSSVSQELWTLLHDFCEEKGCSVRLDWDWLPPPELRDSRAAVAGLVVDLPYRFRHPQHINLLELEALISLIRGLVD